MYNFGEGWETDAKDDRVLLAINIGEILKVVT